MRNGALAQFDVEKSGLRRGRMAQTVVTRMKRAGLGIVSRYLLEAYCILELSTVVYPSILLAV